MKEKIIELSKKQNLRKMLAVVLAAAMFAGLLFPAIFATVTGTGDKPEFKDDGDKSIRVYPVDPSVPGNRYGAINYSDGAGYSFTFPGILRGRVPMNFLADPSRAGDKDGQYRHAAVHITYDNGVELLVFPLVHTGYNFFDDFGGFARGLHCHIIPLVVVLEGAEKIDTDDPTFASMWEYWGIADSGDHVYLCKEDFGDAHRNGTYGNLINPPVTDDKKHIKIGFGDYTLIFDLALKNDAKPDEPDYCDVAKPVFGKMNVTKVWLGENGTPITDTDSIGGKTVEQLNDMITFSPELGLYKFLKPKDTINVNETIDTSSWDSADGKMRYTIEQVSIEVDGDDSATSLTIAANGTHTIVFTNKVTAENISGELTVSKVWLDEDDNPIGTEIGGKTIDELNAMINFSPTLGTQIGLAPGTVISDIGETLPVPASWLVGNTRYTIEKVKVEVDDNGTATSLTIAEKGKHTIVFTNKVTSEDISATLNVSKVWLDEDDNPIGTEIGGKTIDQLNDLFDFSPAIGNYDNLTPGTQYNDIKETLKIPGTDTWDSDDGNTRYTIVPVSVEVDDDDTATSLTVAEKGNHTIVFTNKVTAIDIEDKTATLTVTKTWQGDLHGYSASALNAMITFKPSLGTQNGLTPGTVINNIDETLPDSWYSTDGKTRYTIEQVSILVDNVAGTSLTVAENGNHAIVFTNRLKIETIPDEPVKPKLKITKEWTGVDRPAGVEAELTNGYNFSADYVELNIGTMINFWEEDIDDVIIGNDTYSFELTGVKVNGSAVDSINFSAQADNLYDIVFTNNVTKRTIPEYEPVKPKLKITKAWTGVDRPAGVEAKLTNGYNFSADYVELNIDDTVNFWEETINNVTVDGYIYKFNLASVTLTFNETPVPITGDSINFKAVDGGVYDIVFTNNAVREQIPEPKYYNIRVNYINSETRTPMSISFNEITGIAEGGNWDAAALASLQFTGYTLVNIDGDPVTGSNIQRDQVINVYYAPITIPTTEPTTEPTTQPITQPTTQPTTQPVTQPTTRYRGTTELTTVPEPEEITTTEEIVVPEPTIEPTTEPTIEAPSEEEIIEEEIVEPSVPLGEIVTPDEPPTLAALERIIPSPVERATIPVVETVEEFEEVEEESVPLGDFPAEEKKDNPQTGDGILTIVLTAIVALTGAGAAIFMKKRSK